MTRWWAVAAWQRGVPTPSTILSRTAESNLATARSMLNRMAAYFSGGRLDAHGFPWHQLTYAQVADFRTMVARPYSPGMAQNYLGALRSVLREYKRFGLLSPDEFDTLTDVAPVRGERLPAGRHVPPEELEELFAYLDTLDDATGARDRAAFALLRGTGIRRAEAYALTLDCWNAPKRQLMVNKGKGNKQRIVFVPDWVIEEVERWFWHRGHPPGALLCALDRHGNVRHRSHLTPHALWCSLSTRIKHSGVPPFTLHDRRRTFAGDLLEAGHDIVKVQRAMGTPRQT